MTGFGMHHSIGNAVQQRQLSNNELRIFKLYVKIAFFSQKFFLIPLNHNKKRETQTPSDLVHCNHAPFC